MAEKWLAVLGLLACLGVWAGMALGPVRRARWLRRWHLVQARLAKLGPWLKTRVQRPRQDKHAKQDAKQAAADAIARARRRPKVDRDGNVYRPDAFNDKGRDGDDKLH